MHSFSVSKKILCGDLSPNDKYLVLGTKNSCLRIIDLKSFSTIKIIRLFKKNKDIS